MQVREMSLSGNQLRADMQRLRFEAGDSLTNASWLDGGSWQPGRGRELLVLPGGASQEAGSRAGLQLVRDEDEVARLRRGAHIIDCRSESKAARAAPALPCHNVSHMLLMPGRAGRWLTPAPAVRTALCRWVRRWRAAGDAEAHGDPHLRAGVQALLSSLMAPCVC